MGKVKHALGAIESPIDVRNYKAVCCASGVEYPKEFELYKPRTKNQNSTSSCVAHALSSVVEYFNFVQEKTSVSFSTEWIYGNRTGSNHRGLGMITSNALKNLTKFGDCPESLFKGNSEVPQAIQNYEAKALELYPDAYPHRISKYFVVSGESVIKSCLMQYGPVVIAVTWRKGTTVENGILRLHPETEVDGGHCMYIYGWNEIGWKVANSWGTFWGDKGNCIIPYDENIRELWGVEDNIVSDKAHNEKIQELNAKIVQLTEENAELKRREQEYTDEILRLSNEILEKNTLLTHLQTTNENLEDENEAVKKAIQEAQKTIEENLKKVFEMRAQLEELKKDSAAKDDLINEYKKTIEQLNKKLLDIDKPFNSKIGQLVAKVLNAIINLFKKKEV